MKIVDHQAVSKYDKEKLIISKCKTNLCYTQFNVSVSEEITSKLYSYNIKIFLFYEEMSYIISEGMIFFFF